MIGTNQVSRTLREQALVDLCSESGAYASAAVGKSAVFDEGGQGRPLPRVRYKAATATLKCTTYHGSGVDRKGDIGKAATVVEDICSLLGLNQSKVFEGRYMLLEMARIEDHWFLTASIEGDAFGSTIGTIFLCDPPSTSAQNEPGIRKWLSLNDSIQAILKFAVQKGDFARIAKLAETVAGDECAVSEFNAAVMLGKKKEVVGVLVPDECTIAECDVRIASCAD